MSSGLPLNNPKLLHAYQGATRVREQEEGGKHSLASERAHPHHLAASTALSLQSEDRALTHHPAQAPPAPGGVRFGRK